VNKSQPCFFIRIITFASIEKSLYLKLFGIIRKYMNV